MQKTSTMSCRSQDSQHAELESRLTACCRAAMLAGLLVMASGCGTLMGRKVTGEGFQVQTAFRAAVPVAWYDTNVGPSLKATREDPQGLDLQLALGLECCVRNPYVRFGAGVDLRTEVLAFADEYERGISDTEQRGGPTVFTRIVPGYCTGIAFLKAEALILERVLLGLELGATYTELKAEAGLKTDGEWTTVREDSWSGSGTKLDGIVGYKRQAGGIFALHLSRESYAPSFLGEDADIDITTGFVEYRKDF